MIYKVRSKISYITKKNEKTKSKKAMQYSKIHKTDDQKNGGINKNPEKI